MIESPLAQLERVQGEDARNSQYDAFAAIYNRHFGHFAVRVAPILERLLPKLPPDACILDLCCGTGQLAAAFAERGYRVTGIDGSPEMLRLARQNAPGAAFFLGDARTFQLPETFHGAVSTFDSVNHLLSPADLAAAFANVYRALRPGGAFVFDMNLEEGFRSRWWGAWQAVMDGVSYEIRATYCPATKTGSNHLKLARGGGDANETIEILERCYSEAEVREALRAAGFAGVTVYDAHRDLNLLGETGRGFFVCRKAGSAGTPAPDSGGGELSNHENLDRWNRRGDRKRSPRSNRRCYRDRDQCIADAVWPAAASERELGSESRRLHAIDEVLCTLPPEPYERLRLRAGGWQWYIASHLVLGQVSQATAPALVYLSPLLEQQTLAVNVAVVAHELAHVILKHELTELDRPAYDDQESAVWQSIRSWGFQPEADEANIQLSRQAVQGLVFGPLSGTI